MGLRDDLAHLYRRAGFGAREDELDMAERRGYAPTVDLLLQLERPDPAGDAVAPPTFTSPTTPASVDPAAKQQAQKARAAEGTALATWWLARMAASGNPLREKLTLLWHGHFATSIEKVREPALMYRQNQLFRSLGAGHFDALALAVAEDPAMLLWLDANTNKKGKPNENFARELLELFTLGIGNYGESDVKEAARCFTGWSYDRTTDAFLVRPRQHDDGTKTVLGTTGNLDGTDVIRVATHEPASARFIAAKVWSHLAYPVTADDAVLDPLVSAYGPSLDVRALLKATLSHPQFLSDAARQGLVKQPIEYVVGAARSLGVDVRRPAVLATLRALAQVPFAPPSVGGWPQNGYWLSSATALARARFAATAVAAADLRSVIAAPTGDRVAAAARLLSVTWTPETEQVLAGAAGDPRTLMTLALVAPEYVLN